jgi:signal transduction histidine kinase/DNA-binding response OmpR family regulator
MNGDGRIGVLLVDREPARLLPYRTALEALGAHAVKADCMAAALRHLRTSDIAVVLIAVDPPGTEGFDLAAAIRQQPHLDPTAIIFLNADHLSDQERMRGHGYGTVDIVALPVAPEILAGKVKVFTDLHHRTRRLEAINRDLEMRFAERTAALEASSQRLHESEARLRLAQDAGGIVSWEWEPATGAMIWSKGVAALLGLDSDDDCPLMATFLNLVVKGERDEVGRELWKALGTGLHYESEFHVIWPDGSVHCLAARANSITPEAGMPGRMIGVIFDVTQRRKATEVLNDLNNELERRVEERTLQLVQLQKSEALGQITGGVAHDFNNLLAAILANLELLQNRLTNDPASCKLIDSAIQGVDRGSTLTRRMLAFARRQDLASEPVDILGLLNGMTDLLQRSVGPLTQIETRLPLRVAPALIDPHQLELAILNLAVNARDAMPRGGTLTIAVAEEGLTDTNPLCLKAGRYVRLSVSDTGTGMDEATLSRATEPFFTTKEVGKGTGLGLSMVHGLVGQSGGTLRIRSRPGEGTTIDLWLPQIEAPAPCETVPPAHQPKSQSPSPTSSPRSCRLLLVDDDELVRMGMALVLEDIGYTVIQARSGHDALALLRQGQPVDVVLTDHAMPGMTGVQLIPEIKTLCPEVPVILATGFADIPDDAGMMATLSKPFTRHTLADTLARVMGFPQPERPKTASLLGRGRGLASRRS